jgi:hypothetical protein
MWPVETELSISTSRAAIGPVRLIQALSMEIALPSNATKQLPGIGLALVAREQPQARLDHLALGPEPGRSHRLGEQRVVDLDLGPHYHVS